MLTFSRLALGFVTACAGSSALNAYRQNKNENEQVNRDVHELARSRRGLGDVVPNTDCLKINGSADIESCHTVSQAVKRYRIQG